MEKKTLVAVMMGSKSDLPNLKKTFEILGEFGIGFTARVLSAHRTPHEAVAFVEESEKAGVKIFICAAGMAAHLGGVVAAHTVLPVIGVPMSCEPFNGLDSLFSMVQMPPGIPVATVTVGKNGAENAALLAISMLALSDHALLERLKDFRRRQTAKVLDADREIQSLFP